MRKNKKLTKFLLSIFNLYKTKIYEYECMNVYECSDIPYIHLYRESTQISGKSYPTNSANSHRKTQIWIFLYNYLQLQVIYIHMYNEKNWLTK